MRTRVPCRIIRNILRRDFSADTINQKWCTDITYIHVQKEGWTYLASVMDLCSRKIIGYAYGTSMTAELAVEAVKNACLNVKDTSGIILHSDLGSQYTSLAFEGYLAERGILHSFSRKGNPYDNACIESFHSVLKKEEIYDPNLSPSDFEDTLSDEEAEERSFREAQMWTAIDALPERCREIFLLNKRDGMKYREIAAKFQISVNTVDNHISKALRLIREGAQKVYAFLFN